MHSHSSPHPAPVRSRLLMLASAACFIANVLLIRALSVRENAGLWVITSSRFVVGLGLVLLVYRNEFRPARLFTERKLIERGLLGGIGVLGFYYTVGRLGAGRATFINNTYVIWGGLLAAWVLRERLRPSLLAGAVITLFGLGLLTNPLAGGRAAGLCDALALLVAVGSAWIVVTIRQLHQREHTSTIFGAQCVYGLLLCGGPALAGWSAPTAFGAGMVFAAGLTAGVGQLCMTQAFRDLGVAEGSLFQMLVPLGIATGGMLFFGEHFTASELVGGALILAGTAAPALLPRSIRLRFWRRLEARPG